MSPRAIADVQAVRDVITTYARGVDRRDLALVASCFTADCAYAGGLGTGTIADALDALAHAMERYARTMHFVGTQDVSVDGDVARSETCCVAYHVRPDGRHLTVGVVYRDALVRTRAGWRIRSRRVRTEWSREDAPRIPT